MEEELARAVGPRVRQRVEHAPVGEAFKASLSERRAQQVLTEPLQPGAIVGAHGAVRVEIEALEVRVARAEVTHGASGSRPMRKTGAPGRAPDYE